MPDQSLSGTFLLQQSPKNKHWCYDLTSIVDYNGAKDCYKREGELVRCLRGTKYENNTLQCTQCISDFKFKFSEEYNHDICDEECEEDSFNKRNWCYKCDDKLIGNPGCIKESGCTYNSANDQLNCNECKNGYYKSTYGQCLSCSIENNKACLECNYNLQNHNLNCTKCMDGYFLNSDGQCELINCEEHPEVTTGCIICSDKINEYKPQKKCQSCKKGFFKTKNESCVFCKAIKNGGPNCEICEYSKDENGMKQMKLDVNIVQ